MEVVITAGVHPVLSLFCFREAAVGLATGRRVHVRIMGGGESLNEVDGVLNACLGSGDEVAGERRGAVCAEKNRLRDECRSFLTQEYRGPHLLCEGMNKSQGGFIGLAVGVVIEVLRGRVAEGARTEKRWQLLSHQRVAERGGGATMARAHPLELETA
jgi:hypothetical protein